MSISDRFSWVAFKPSTTALYKPTAAAWTASTSDTRAMYAKIAFHLPLDPGSPGTRPFTWISRDWIGLRHLEDAPATSAFHRSRCIWRSNEVTELSHLKTPYIIKWYNAQNPLLSKDNFHVLPLSIPLAFPAFSITMTVNVARDRNTTKIFSLCIASILPCNKLEILFGYPNICLSLFHMQEVVLEITL